MNDALENHKGRVSIGDRTITNLRFGDDIDGLKGKDIYLYIYLYCVNFNFILNVTFN